MHKEQAIKIRLWQLPISLNCIDKKQDIQRLQVGNTIRSDLGTVRLPEMPEGCIGYKALEQHWLTATGMQQCLEGKIPAANDIIKTQDLFTHEPRLGIARDNTQRAVEDGRLYQTQHLRLHADVHIELEAKNLPPVLLTRLADNKQNSILRLGGEGRMASLKVSHQAELLPNIASNIRTTFTIHFINPADFGGNMFPQGFNKTDNNGQRVWRGTINDIEFEIESAVMGKVHREGGWNMQAHQPHPVKSYIPAGSVWFCRLRKSGTEAELNEKLHKQCIGLNTAYGRGQILIGQWQDR